MNFQGQGPAENLFRSFLLFFPTAVSLIFSLATFIVGVAFDIVGLRWLSPFLLRLSGYVFSFIFLPLSQQSGLFKNFQGRQGTPTP